MSARWPFRAGHRLRAPEIALAAALGQGISAGLPARSASGCFRPATRFAIPATLLLPGQIWDANRWMLRHLLERLGCRVADHGILADDAPGVEQALQQAAHDHDLLISSGGISVGAEDHVGAVIRRRGSLDIWRLAVKPGKPVAFGDIDTCPILALPGNPIASMVLFLMLGRGHRAAPGRCGGYGQCSAFACRRASLAPKSQGGANSCWAACGTRSVAPAAPSPWKSRAPPCCRPAGQFEGLIDLPEAAGTRRAGRFWWIFCRWNRLLR